MAITPTPTPALEILEIKNTAMLTPTIAFMADPDFDPSREEYQLYVEYETGEFVVRPFTHLSNQIGDTLIGRAKLKLYPGIPTDISVVVTGGDVIRQGNAVIGFDPIWIRDDDKIIQQGIYDAIIDGHTFTDRFGRTANVLHNGYYEPEDMSDAGELGAVPMPFVEIKRAYQVGADNYGNHAIMYEYQLVINVCDTETIGASGDVTHLESIARDIIKVLRAGVGLNAFGIYDKSLSYNMDTTGDISQGDNLNTVAITVAISQVQAT